MKRSTRFKMQMKSLKEFNCKHPRKDTFDINIELDSVKKQVRSCNKCELCELKENNPNNGECFGKLLINCLHRTRFNKTILFIGQNPSINRYDAGMGAFVGVDKSATLDNFKTSGDLFRLCIEKSLIKDYDLYVDNVVHCSTPNNDVPTQEQINKCIDWILLEIDLLSPDLIVCLGNVVYDIMKDKLLEHKITKIWHPSACMYKGKESIPEFIEQLNSLKKIV